MIKLTPAKLLLFSVVSAITCLGFAYLADQSLSPYVHGFMVAHLWTSGMASGIAAFVAVVWMGHLS